MQRQGWGLGTNLLTSAALGWHLLTVDSGGQGMLDRTCRARGWNGKRYPANTWMRLFQRVTFSFHDVEYRGVTKNDWACGKELEVVYFP